MDHWVAAMLAEYIFLNSSLLSLYVNIKILYHTCYYLYMMQIKRSESESESESGRIILVTCMYHIHFGLSSNILLQHIHVINLSWTPSLFCSRWLPNDSPWCMVLSTALWTCYCLSGAISVLGLLLSDVWVWLSYHNISSNVSETSVVLPGPASMNPTNHHVTHLRNVHFFAPQLFQDCSRSSN